MTKQEINITPEVATPEKDTSVEAFISQAIETKVPVETLERLFGLREKVKAEKAKEAFMGALANFQENCPIIQKNKKVLNKDGQSVRYTYASLDSIVEQIKKPLAKSGLSYTWDVKNEPGFIRAIATITHVFGHSQTSEFLIPIDTEGYMTAPQKYASALTFAKRYSLCNALGILTGDEDTDATDVGKEATAKSNKAKILFLLRSLGKEVKTKEEISKTIKTLTQLDLEEKNYGEIVGRLEVIVQEKQENENPKIS